MTVEKIARINSLAAKAKTPEGLTQAEKEEQTSLRREYIDEVKASLLSELDATVIEEPDGTRHKLSTES